jgi:hypothetical protein
MSAHVHIEYDGDTTEREVGVIVGYVDPNEQICSESELEPLPPLPGLEVDIAHRWHKWRLYRPDGSNAWIAMQPLQIDAPMFRGPSPDFRQYGFTSSSGARALTELQLAILIAESEQDV